MLNDLFDLIYALIAQLINTGILLILCKCFLVICYGLELACTKIFAPIVAWSCTELAICSRLLERVAHFSLFIDR